MQILDCSGCPNLTHVNLLAHSQSLTCINLTGCNISNEDVIGLGSIISLKILNLKASHNITNVDPLVNVRTLNLSDCRGVDNISNLGNTSRNLKKLILDGTRGSTIYYYIH